MSIWTEKRVRREAAKELGITEADIRETEDLPDAVHIFSHVEWHMWDAESA